MPWRASVRFLHPFGAVLEREGVALTELQAAAGITRDVYEDPDARVPFMAVRGFLLAAAARTRHDALGLEAARQHDQAQFQLLHYLASSTSTVREAADDLARYQALLTDARVMRPEPCDGGLLLRFHGPTTLRARVLVEYVLGGLALVLQRAIGARDGARPGALGSGPLSYAAWFSYEAPSCAQAYRDFFGAPVRFDVEATGLWIAPASLELRPAQANPRVHEILEQQITEQLRRITAITSFAERVRLLIVDDLADPNASLDRVAAKLHMSRSTLKRKLAAERRSYTELLDEARRGAALEYLRRDLSLHEVAFLLGYRDQSAFHRAFRRWNRLTPNEYRARMQAERGRGRAGDSLRKRRLSA